MSLEMCYAYEEGVCTEEARSINYGAAPSRWDTYLCRHHFDLWMEERKELNQERERFLIWEELKLPPIPPSLYATNQ